MVTQLRTDKENPFFTFQFAIRLVVVFLVACLSFQEAWAMSFSRGFKGAVLQNVRTHEIRSAYGWYGYVKPQSDFDEHTKDVAYSTGTGWIAFWEWKVLNKIHCYDADRPSKTAVIPSCIPSASQSFEGERRLAINDLVLRFRIGYVASETLRNLLFWAVFSPVLFFVFYPIGSIAWHLSKKRVSSKALTFLLTPFLWVLIRQGIPVTWELLRDPWWWLITGPLWFCTSLFGLVWKAVEARVSVPSKIP